MTSTSPRRWPGLALLAVLVGLAAGWLHLMNVALRPAAFLSGLALLGVVLFLTVFNARKKLPFLPLLNASRWMRLHSYAGWFAVALFLLHIRFQVPRGGLEIGLAVLFLAVSVSGIFGLVLSRTVPPRLTRSREELLFERIPALRHELRAQVERLVADSVSETESSTLADYYTTRLKRFFDRPQNLWLHLLGSSRPLHARLARLAALDRYLNDKERAVAAALADAIRAKDNLDLHLACQGVLKGWLFVHIPLTYGLILVAMVHGFLAWSFTH